MADDRHSRIRVDRASKTNPHAGNLIAWNAVLAEERLHAGQDLAANAGAPLAWIDLRAPQPIEFSGAAAPQSQLQLGATDFDAETVLHARNTPNDENS